MFKGACVYCDKNGHIIKDCQKMADEKNGSNKISWRKPKLANNVVDKLDLWILNSITS